MIKNELGSSRMDTVLKMLLIAFVSLLAFSSGVYFGKQMSDSDHQLKALESDFSSQTYTAASDEAHGSSEQIEEEEVAALSDKYMDEEKGGRGVASANEHGAEAHGDDHAAPAGHGAKADAHGEDGHGDAHAAAPAAKADAHAAPAKTAAGHGDSHGDTHTAPVAKTAAKAGGKVDLSAAHAAAQRVAQNAAPTAGGHGEAPAKAEGRTPTSLPKTVGANSVVEFTVQVASYPTPEAAKDHANQLVKKGFPAFPVEATVNGKTWYRVSVGSFKTMKDATTYRAQLLKQADLQSAIVQKITR